VLGEGVEVEADVDELGQSGIDGISGYYYSRPFGSLAGVEQWLEESDS
jgi:EAL domain-containing protein (putative c-di-GMP-specific phosphodiesterase class I)